MSHTYSHTQIRISGSTFFTVYLANKITLEVPVIMLLTPSYQMVYEE